jgi:hypothetical protein
MNFTLRHALAALLVTLSFTAPAWSQTDDMQFVAYPPTPQLEKLMGDHAWRIFATGKIDAASDKRLASLIADKHIPLDSELYLHSPGGALEGGLALGHVIREHELRTFIGQFDPTSKYVVGSKPGYCYSACAMAFLGGEYRYWTNGSMYGVHRFFWNKHSDSDADLAQIMSAAVVEYIRSMGVDTKIFTLASQAGSSEVITPSHETLLALNVVNDGRKPVKWTIESFAQGSAQGIYLKGEQETANGIDKFMVMCSSPMGLYALYHAGMNADEVMTWPVNWLFLDHERVRMDRQLKSKTMNKRGQINLLYYLNSDLLAAIAKAKSVGVGLQPTTGAAVFSGFDFMPFEGGAAKLPGFLSACNRGGQ